MDLPDKFKFEIPANPSHPKCFAEKCGDCYKVSWEDSKLIKKGSTLFYSSEAIDAVTEGIWKIIKEEENMTTKLKPFNLEKALAGEKVVTRDGRNVVEIVKLSKAVGSQSVIAVKEDGNWASYSSDGYLWSEGSLSDNDLFMAPIKKQGWVNIYGNYTTETGGHIFKTKEEAMDIAGMRLIDTVMIEWEE